MRRAREGAYALEVGGGELLSEAAEAMAGVVGHARRPYADGCIGSAPLCHEGRAGIARLCTVAIACAVPWHIRRRAGAERC